MVRSASLGLLVSASFALPSCASVQAPAEALEVRGVLPLAGYDEIVDGKVRSIVRFYRAPQDGVDQDGVARGEWFATRTLYRGGGAEVIEITTAGCAGLPETLNDLADIELGRLDLPGVSEPNRGLEPGLSGPTYRIWGRRREGGLNSSITATAMSGRIGEFGRAAGDRLRSCWSAYQR